MELSGLGVRQQQAAALQGSAADLGSLRPDETAPESKPVLAGDNVKVRVLNDFEKLLAEFEAENQENRIESCKSQLALILTVLCGHHATVSEAYAGVLAANETLSTATAAVVSAEADCALAKAELVAAKAELENASTPEEEEAAEARIAEAERKLDAGEQALAKATQAQTEAEAALTEAMTTLDSVRGKELIVAVDVLSRRLVAAAHEHPDGDALEEKATEIVKKLDASVERLEEMSDKEIRDELANLAPDLVFLVTANYAVAPGDLPQYERRV